MRSPVCRATPGRAPRTGAGAIALVASVAAAALVGSGGACAKNSEPKPVATLASSPQAAAAFDAIRSAWSDLDTRPGTLRPLLEHFIAHFGTDGLVPLARVYLALVAMQQNDFATADAELARTAHLPPGTAHDLWTVARARRLRLQSDPESALVLLRPLVGKNVDPVTRAEFEEELTLSALATHRDYEAISYMDAWVRASSEEERRRTLSTVAGLVQRLPREVLIGALEAMRTQRANLGYGVEIERILARRLAQIANESGDAELARMLLDPDAGAIVVPGEAGVELNELATSRRGLNLVQGRTVGLLLPTESPELRDESADVLRGVMWALGLPRGLRATAGAGGAARAAARGACGMALAAAPPLADPGPDEDLRLVTRDDAGSADRTEVSLDELVGEGAGIIVAGLDASTADRALRWSENHGVPLLALAAPPAPPDAPGFGFVLGEARDSVLRALAAAVPSLTTEKVAPVVDASEVALFPPQGGARAGLTLLGPVSCDIPATRAGEPRFPLTEWERAGAHAWLVSGSPRCAEDVLVELGSTRARGVVAMTLEAAALPAHVSGLRVVTAAAGMVPESPNPAADRGADDDLARFAATLGSISWWTALGRDAATLARVALDHLPTDTVGDARAVAERRTRARDELVAAHVRLWTTESATLDPGHALKRTVCAVDAPVR